MCDDVYCGPHHSTSKWVSHTISLSTRHTIKRVHHVVFSVMYTICEGPNLDAYTSQSVMSGNCQHDIIHEHK